MKTITNTKYGIMDIRTNELLTYYMSSNAGGDFCVENEYILSRNDEDIWLVDDYETALKALTTDTKWYNADYNTPSHGTKISPNTHKVVKVENTSVITLEE